MEPPKGFPAQQGGAASPRGRVGSWTLQPWARWAPGWLRAACSSWRGRSVGSPKHAAQPPGGQHALNSIPTTATVIHGELSPSKSPY